MFMGILSLVALLQLQLLREPIFSPASAHRTTGSEVMLSH
jgi:hypothetical protein